MTIRPIFTPVTVPPIALADDAPVTPTLAIARRMAAPTALPKATLPMMVRTTAASALRALALCCSPGRSAWPRLTAQWTRTAAVVDDDAEPVGVGASMCA